MRDANHPHRYNGDMRRTLKIHPDSRCPAVTGIDVLIRRPHPGSLSLHYFVTGTIRDLRLPPATMPLRDDGLWQHTCFEAFIRVSIGSGYYEFNFAPSAQWAAYRFSGYRSGMCNASTSIAPRIDVQSGAEGYWLLASLNLNRLPDVPCDSEWRLGVSAVIEETNGRKSYWAIAHPPGKADFHHSDCFVHDLASAERL